MTYEEITSLIADFSKQNPNIIFSEKVHGIIVSDTAKGFVLQLLVTEKQNIDSLRGDEIMPKSYTYNFEGKEKNIQSDVIVKPSFKTHPSADENTELNSVPVRAGDSAYGIGFAGFGTAGWNIFLNGTLISISNWHVFCPKGNDTPIGNKVIINNSDVATLYAFQRMNEFEFNVFDYAIAKFNNPSDVIGEMRKCEDGSIYPYPQKLSTNVKLGDGAKYYKVGARTPICREGGTLKSIGNVQVDYKNGSKLWFEGQLFFSKMTDSGDSGCMIIRASDNTVTGLNFSGNPESTTANPIFNIGWYFTGSFKSYKGSEIPVYTTVKESLSMKEYNLFADPIPDLSAGKIFLGKSYGLVYSNGSIPNLPSPQYPPIRPNVQVEYIPIAPSPGRYNVPFYSAKDGQEFQYLEWLFFAFG